MVITSSGKNNFLLTIFTATIFNTSTAAAPERIKKCMGSQIKKS